MTKPRRIRPLKPCRMAGAKALQRSLRDLAFGSGEQLRPDATSHSTLWSLVFDRKPLEVRMLALPSKPKPRRKLHRRTIKAQTRALPRKINNTDSRRFPASAGLKSRTRRARFKLNRGCRGQDRADIGRASCRERG